MKQRLLSLLLAFSMMTSMVVTARAANVSDFSDMPDNFATQSLLAAVDNGLLSGNNGKIMPTEMLTRAQMAAILVRAFGAENTTDLSQFTDVPSSAWYYDELSCAVQMGIFQGNGSTMNPTAAITRQEAFVVLARAFSLEADDTSALDAFVDGNAVGAWAAEEVAAMVATGYVQGNGTNLYPANTITRQEFAVVMDRMVKTYITEAGTYSDFTDGSVMINQPDVTLENTTITGDLIIGDGVGEGDVTLDNVTVDGALLVRGGGVNSVVITGNSQVSKVIVSKMEGNVRVSVEGNAQVDVVTVADGKDDVIVQGAIGSLELTAPETTVYATDATIADVSVTGDDSKVVLGNDTTVSTGESVSGNTTTESTTTTTKPGFSGNKDTYYTVTFDANGGIDVDSQSIRKGYTIETAPTTTREGCTFLGWFTEEDTEFVFGTDTVTEAMTLSAKWEITVSDEAELRAALGFVQDGEVIYLDDNIILEAYQPAGSPGIPDGATADLQMLYFSTDITIDGQEKYALDLNGHSFKPATGDLSFTAQDIDFANSHDWGVVSNQLGGDNRLDVTMDGVTATGSGAAAIYTPVGNVTLENTTLTAKADYKYASAVKGLSTNVEDMSVMLGEGVSFANMTFDVKYQDASFSSLEQTDDSQNYIYFADTLAKYASLSADITAQAILAADFTIDAEMTIDGTYDAGLVIPDGKTLTVDGTQINLYGTIDNNGTIICKGAAIINCVFGGEINNAGTLTMNETSELWVSDGSSNETLGTGTLNNTGTLTITENAYLAGEGAITMDASGTFVCDGSIRVKNEDALAQAITFDAKKIDMGKKSGKIAISLSKDITIPNGVTVTILEKATVTVEDDATLTVEEGATLTVNGKITGNVDNKNGSLVIYNPS